MVGWGEPQERCLFTYKVFAPDGIITSQDIEQVIYETCRVWNTLTGEKAIPDRQYISYIITLMDTDGDSFVSFKDFEKCYSELPDILDLKGFLNQKELKYQAKYREILGFSKAKYKLDSSYIESLCSSKEELLLNNLTELH